jgi:hypothetical protein
MAGARLIPILQSPAGEVGYILASKGETLAYIPLELPKSVVFIGYKDSVGADHVMGSAFWVINIQPEEDLRKEYQPAYLVTAAHVLDDIKEKQGNRVWLRANVKGRAADWFSLGSIDLWEYHPDVSVDIAILKRGIEPELDHFGWPTNSFVTEATAKEDGRDIELGDEVFSAGLFWPHMGRSRNVPIVRVGNIAALRDEKIEMRKDVFSDLYLMEFRSVGGLSGSPVFIDVLDAKLGKHAAGNVLMGPSRFRLVGVLSGHFKGADDQDVSNKVPKSELEKLNMGIAYVTPAEKILGALAEFMPREKEEIEEHRKKKLSFISVDGGAQRSNVAAQLTSTGFEIPAPDRGKSIDDLFNASRKKD